MLAQLNNPSGISIEKPDKLVTMRGPLVLSSLLALSFGSASPAPPPIPAAPATEPVALATLAAPAPVFVLDEVPLRREPPPPPPPRPDDGSLRVGSRGEAVLQLEERLAALRYMVGKVDGIFDRATYFGVVAFQKVEGLSRHGRGDAATLALLRTARIPTPGYSGPADHLEVDIPRQVVFVVRGGEMAAVLATSTGNNKLFTSQGWTRRAVTPNGVFKITRKINGMRISPLGQLYKPSYFNGGIAFHGNPSVPVNPASHGCVRLPMAFADWFFSSASPVGMTVYVYGGPTGANPQPWIDDRPASPEPTPSQEPTTSGEPTTEPEPTESESSDGPLPTDPAS